MAKAKKKNERPRRAAVLDLSGTLSVFDRQVLDVIAVRRVTGHDTITTFTLVNAAEALATTAREAWKLACELRDDRAVRS